ncbi:Eco57I restriction-modification methylase domain-containing protein [Aerococcus viridans]|uniref:Restriction endonuclease n=1 Tax=Aerococcus viridans TaxID=1377 RepID=A0A2J9PPV8_9LACT|nr:Eco57I restriction-modification methylase domain-containing protein [Aerococcus viridans]PNL92347.1 restriction endonuclease [Aerococcus viridans]
MREDNSLSLSDLSDSTNIRENESLLSLLLKDHTTGKNIKWGTDSYINHGYSFRDDQEIKINLITGWYEGFIRPRVDKDIDLQLERQRNKAEVFTPSWVIKLQVNAALKDMEKLPLADFIQTKWLEITCGEAPYMVNRYDMETGEVIPLKDRSGFIDIKFKKLNKKIELEEEWLKLAVEIYKASYGYEYQGDSLLLARENLILTFIDNYFYMFGAFPKEKILLEITKIISLNVFQMDGLTYEVPYSVGGLEESGTQLNLFEEIETEEYITPKLANIKLWGVDKTIEFKLLSERNDTEMKFDVVIGNPPYQMTTEGNNRDVPIYPYFMDEAYKISNKALLITPARFLSDAGQTKSSWNQEMLNNPHLKVLYFDQYSGNIFKNTDIKGGVAITYYDNEKEFGHIEVFIRSKELEKITSKVSSIMEKSINLIHHNRSSYRLSDMVYKDFPEMKNKVKKSERLSITSNIFDKLSDIFLDEHPKNLKDFIGILGRQNHKRKVKWIRRKYIQDHPTIGKWKVFVAKSNGTGAIGEALSEPFVAEPHMIPTQTFITLGNFDTENEAIALNKYIKSKFARVMLSVKKATPDNARKDVWSYVPLQNFQSDSDIDWMGSISDIDSQLYKKYNLDNDDINYIETIVKEME